MSLGASILNLKEHLNLHKCLWLQLIQHIPHYHKIILLRVCLSFLRSDRGNIITGNTEEPAERDCYVPGSVLSASHTVSMGCELSGQSAWSWLGLGAPSCVGWTLLAANKAAIPQGTLSSWLGSEWSPSVGSEKVAPSQGGRSDYLKYKSFHFHCQWRV